MKKTGARLMWATTTPIPDTADGKQKASSIIEKNNLAAEIMARQQVAVDDLYNAIKPHLDKLQNPNDVHFTAEGNEFLGKAAAAAIKTLLK
jgi:acyl-CoA thioesterase-1